MKPPPNQCWEFRDQKVPARVIYLLKEEKINGKDLLLLCVIDALVRPHGAKDGLGCYATNEYLAEAINAHPKHISRMLTKLKDMKLVVEVVVGKQRYLELQWSRTAEELLEMGHEYGLFLRTAHQALMLRGNENVTPNGNNNVTPGGNENVTQNSIVEVLTGNEVERPSRARATDLDGITPLWVDEDRAHRLREEVIKKKLRRPTGSPKAWAKAFAALREVDGQPEELIKETFDAYLPLISNTTMKPNFIPEAFAGTTFREKFPQILSYFAAQKEKYKQLEVKRRKERVRREVGDSPYFYSDKDGKPTLGLRRGDGSIEMFHNSYDLAYAWEAIPAPLRGEYLAAGGSPPPSEDEEP